MPIRTGLPTGSSSRSTGWYRGTRTSTSSRSTAAKRWLGGRRSRRPVHAPLDPRRQVLGLRVEARAGDLGVPRAVRWGQVQSKLIATNIPTLDFATTPMGDRPWSSDGETLLVSIRNETTAARRPPSHPGDGREAEQITFPPPAAAIPTRPTRSTRSRSSSADRSGEERT